MSSTIKTIISTICLLYASICIQAQKEYKVACIAFYNVENLFDTYDDPDIRDEEYLPDGDRAWTQKRYEEKIGNMAYVISQLGTDKSKSGASVIGLCEIENKYVLEDLVKHKYLKERNYEIVHHDSPDRRGIDVAFLYNPKQFELTDTASFELLLMDGEERKYTRDILMASGNLDGEKMHFIVNHWPSRRGGQQRSAPNRNKAAQLCKSVVDSLMTIDKDSKVIIMGDLNDNPDNKSVTSHLMARGKVKDVPVSGLFNPMMDMYSRGVGSNAYRDTWSLFDQMMLSEAYLDRNQEGYFYYQTKIFDKRFLKQKSGRFKGYPFRTFSFNDYQAGYSDHFPVLVYLLKAK